MTDGSGAALTSPAARSEQKVRSRWALSDRDVLGLLLFVLALDAWAWTATDPDFFLPDAFRPIAIGLILYFLLTGWLRWPRLRSAARTASFVPLIGLLVLEVNGRYHSLPKESEAERTQRSDDVLLRYQYRPGYRSGPAGHDIRINSLGLWDQEYAIPKPPGVFRIAVLSSSVGNDPDIPEPLRFHSLLEEMLDDAVPKGMKVEVVNLSVEGYSARSQERLLEKVGLRYEPDLVIEAFALAGAFIQNGADRRTGNSYFANRFEFMVRTFLGGRSVCSFFRRNLFTGYGYNLVVQSSFERLQLLHQVHGFPVLVAVLPALVPFDDPDCVGIYDQVATSAEEAGLTVTRTYRIFDGENYRAYIKEGGTDDFTHVNTAGHKRFAEDLALSVKAMLAKGLPRYR